MPAESKELRDELRLTLLVELRRQFRENAHLAPSLGQLVRAGDRGPNQLGRVEAATRSEREQRAKHDVLRVDVAVGVQLDDSALRSAKDVRWAHADNAYAGKDSHVPFVELAAAMRLQTPTHRRKAVLAQQADVRLHVRLKGLVVAAVAQDAIQDRSRSDVDSGLARRLALEQLERQLSPSVARDLVAPGQGRAEQLDHLLEAEQLGRLVGVLSHECL